MDGDPGERGKNAHRLHRLPAAPGVHHEQGVLAGAGTVHPVQPAVHAEPGLVEPGHLAGGDLPAGVLQEPAEPPGGAGGDRRDRPGRQRDAEQLGQRLRGALLGQELPGVQVDDDRGDPRPVLHRRLRALRGRGLGAVPAAAFPLDQLMLGHLHRGSGRSNTWRRSTPVTGRPARPAPQRPQQPGSWRISRSGLAACASVVPSCPSCPPGLRPLFFRSDAAAAAACPAPRWTAAWTSSAASGSAAPQAQRSAPAPAPAPTSARPARLPAPGAARPPARPAPHRQTSMITGHTRTLQRKITRCTYQITAAKRRQAGPERRVPGS